MWLVESLEKGKVGSRIPNIKYIKEVSRFSRMSVRNLDRLFDYSQGEGK